MCRAAGITTATEEIDHIVPVRDGGAAWSIENLQGLCVECHKRKTAKEESRRARGKTTWGCDAEGRALPLESSHGQA